MAGEWVCRHVGRIPGLISRGARRVQQVAGSNRTVVPAAALPSLSLPQVSAHFTEKSKWKDTRGAPRVRRTASWW
jgi:hypothetical protein